tara:strand:+ start:2082 stop:2744 length:663 start_codon:yes stop_codon:yes gene_type:complete
MTIRNWIYLNNIRWGKDLNEVEVNPNDPGSPEYVPGGDGYYYKDGYRYKSPMPGYYVPHDPIVIPDDDVDPNIDPNPEEDDDDDSETPENWWDDPNHPNWQKFGQWFQEWLYDLIQENAPDTPWWLIKGVIGFYSEGYEEWLAANPDGTWLEFIQHNMGVFLQLIQDAFEKWLDDNPGGNFLDWLQSQPWWPQFQNMLPGWMWPMMPDFFPELFPPRPRP